MLVSKIKYAGSNPATPDPISFQACVFLLFLFMRFLKVFFRIREFGALAFRVKLW